MAKRRFNSKSDGKESEQSQKEPRTDSSPIITPTAKQPSQQVFGLLSPANTKQDSKPKPPEPSPPESDQNPKEIGLEKFFKPIESPKDIGRSPATEGRESAIETEKFLFEVDAVNILSMIRNR